MTTTHTKSGERVLAAGASITKATLKGGPRDGEVLEAIGFGLPSELRYPVHGDSSLGDRRYTLRGVAGAYWYEFTGTVLLR